MELLGGSLGRGGDAGAAGGEDSGAWEGKRKGREGKKKSSVGQFGAGRRWKEMPKRHDDAGAGSSDARGRRTGARDERGLFRVCRRTWAHASVGSSRRTVELGAHLRAQSGGSDPAGAMAETMAALVSRWVRRRDEMGARRELTADSVRRRQPVCDRAVALGVRGSPAPPAARMRKPRPRRRYADGPSGFRFLVSAASGIARRRERCDRADTAGSTRTWCA